IISISMHDAKYLSNLTKKETLRPAKTLIRSNDQTAEVWWSGIMALFSFALSLFVRKSRLLIIGIPTVVTLFTWFVMPTNYVLFSYLFPETATMGRSPIFFFLEPIAALLIVIAVLLLAVRKRKNILV
ncbi:MAG: hypothetical protein LBU07_04900, partial [Coriobacteriales bacterium]|nr:hypothetical protein [Coriobacteriales bacterium]